MAMTIDQARTIVGGGGGGPATNMDSQPPPTMGGGNTLPGDDGGGGVSSGTYEIPLPVLQSLVGKGYDPNQLQYGTDVEKAYAVYANGMGGPTELSILQQAGLITGSQAGSQLGIGGSTNLQHFQFGNTLYSFNPDTGQIQALASQPSGGGGATPYGSSQAYLDQQLELERRQLGNQEAQQEIENKLAWQNLLNSQKYNDFGMRMNLAGQFLNEQQAAEARRQNDLGLIGNRAASGRSLADFIRAYAGDLRAAEQDPFRLGEYMTNVARVGGANPLQTLIGEGVSIEPQLPDPYADPRFQNLLGSLYDYGTPPPVSSVPDRTAADTTSAESLARVREAYERDPQAAAIFFSQKPEDLQRMFGAAGGGEMMLDRPVTVFDIEGNPVATAGENGPEMMDMEDDGMRFEPQEGVSRTLRPGQSTAIAEMTMMNLHHKMMSGDGMDGMADGRPQVGGYMGLMKSPLTEYADGGNMRFFGKPLIGSLAQRLFLTNPELARRWYGKPITASILQAIFGSPQTQGAPALGTPEGPSFGSPVVRPVEAGTPLEMPPSRPAFQPPAVIGAPPNMWLSGGPRNARIASRRPRPQATRNYGNDLDGFAAGGTANVRIGRGGIGADRKAEWDRAFKAADPGARRRSAERERTVYGNIPGVEKRVRQDENAALNDERLIALRDRRDARRATQPAVTAGVRAGGGFLPRAQNPRFADNPIASATPGGVAGGGVAGASTITPAQASAKALGATLRSLGYVAPEAIAFLEQGQAPPPGSWGNTFQMLQKRSPLLAQTALGVIQQFGNNLQDYSAAYAGYNIASAPSAFSVSR